MKLAKFILLLSLLACTSHEDDSVKEADLNPQTNLDSIGKPIKPRVSVPDYKFTPDRQRTPWQGTVCTSVYWNDARGENVLIVSEMETGDAPAELQKFAEDKGGTFSQLFAYHYVMNDSLKKWKPFWTLNDFEIHETDRNIICFPLKPLVSDIDSNGMAETSFAYYNSYDPIDFFHSIKLIYHPDHTKLKVEGSLGEFGRRFRYDNGIDSVPKFSEGFKKYADIHFRHAKKLWLRYSAYQDSISLKNHQEWSK